MADKNEKFPENVAGKYYVDEQCIACSLCENEAEGNFQMKDDQTYAFVYKQPENDSEYEECQQAMDGCPTEAIGDDGEE